MAGQPLAGSVLIYDRIGANKRATWLLMVLFVAILTGLIGAIGLSLGAPIGVLGFVGIALIVYAIFSYFASSSVVLNISGAREVTKEEEWDFVRHVENMAIAGGLPMPRTWVIEDSAPNAFATGRDPQHAHVVATRGLLDKLESREIEAVIAHEMSHIGNYDIRLMTIVVVLVGLIALVSDVFLRFTYWGAGTRRGSRNKGGGGAAILVLVALLAAVLAPIAAAIIKFAISRRREYLADASGALLCRNPEALARALEKISSDHEPLEAANKATEHLYFENPLREHGSFLNSMFSTHPDPADRIRILRSM